MRSLRCVTRATMSIVLVSVAIFVGCEIGSNPSALSEKPFLPDPADSSDLPVGVAKDGPIKSVPDRSGVGEQRLGSSQADIACERFLAGFGKAI